MDERAYHATLWVDDCLAGLWALGVTANRICIKQSDPVILILVDGTIKFRWRGDLVKDHAHAPELSYDRIKKEVSPRWLTPRKKIFDFTA